MNKETVLCIGDSLALPGHSNEYNDTWFYKLKQSLPDYDFMSLFKRSVTTNILVEWGGARGNEKYPMGSDCCEGFKPKIVIIQLGIVDCAPRLFSDHGIEYLLLKVMPSLIRKYYIGIIKKIRKRTADKSYVNLCKFRHNLTNYLNRCTNNNVEKIIFIGIPFPSSRLVKKNPDIIRNVEKYNGLIQTVINEINEEKALMIMPLDSRRYSEEIFEDGYHPNPKGNYYVYKELKTILKV